MTITSYPKTKPLRLTGKKKTKFRRDVAERAGEACEGILPNGRRCGKSAPLKWNGVFYSGHVCHKKSYGAGGGDTMENVYWGCPKCHLVNEHGPQWSGGKDEYKM